MIDHLDALNELILEEENLEAAELAVKHYCRAHSLDVSEYKVFSEYDEQFDENCVYVIHSSEVN